MEQRLATLIGNAVRVARQRLELTQADVAERVGIATEVYGRLERGHMLPSVRTLRKLCLVLSCSSDVLLGLSATAAVTEDGAPQVAEDPPEYRERPEVRRLLRTVRKLDSPRLRLLGQVAHALER
ncbi:helix-turn-helix transcriptional regulator [Corallococcus exiguus]|uniref:XRE family transcriptional regulator n=2 Tax=Corallococcus TaxID=83461 RepID=A0A3A8KKI6_9BACT|nr:MULTISPECIES: helix-turn-helix transcriptional regulator [Corallococcus]RKI49432.1 XRE family transcriptional regulator [Corallococcus sp. AB004]MBN8470209.1 helix-turn-helix transcriptional regulator [Corallococcus exiguus]NBC38608.1 helix-turn-helix domain-containing protein [Corallococcus exiguus]NNB86466.1 helix-turn-helix transcriptional regulator [Corallococcus exiguus]NNB93737.1 helix-turn-helix transcriptional regulator [Corallococcus exiguus]